ncbi:hypothetical protein N8I77_011301 [Diaporthe amygdali]|uniref:Uncharacterized protein n=1 Tax=Phomopsis amygdali TaxID=1214568 RepID=A0AAD9S835_PHOAM|nr:hypothetical protein N8I77_011301 [Diaporthe amygdali]
MEKFPRAAARSGPLSSSHVRTLPDVALRWRLASAVARLASSQLRFVRIFLQCFSGFGACFARHKSGAAIATLEIQGPVLSSGEDQANAGAKTRIPVDWHRPNNCGLPPEALPDEEQRHCGGQEPSRRRFERHRRTIDQGTRATRLTSDQLGQPPQNLLHIQPRLNARY